MDLEIPLRLPAGGPGGQAGGLFVGWRLWRALLLRSCAGRVLAVESDRFDRATKNGP